MFTLRNRQKRPKGCLTLFCLLVLTSCSTLPRERFYDGFIIVTTQAGDNPSSLAARYLNDPAKGWVITEFNDIENLTPGQEVTIPLSPFAWGGLKANGYQTVPILVYFGFSESKTGELVVSEKAFKEQMRFLKENGYRVITLDQLLDFLDFKGQIPEKSVVITFDDGWRSLYDFAFPILRDYGFPATLFVYTDFIGGKKALSWEQIEVLAANGIDIQSKTQTHRNVARLEKEESFRAYFQSLESEISRSKKIIEQKLKKQCKYLAYPYGETNTLVVELLKKYGYRAAFTVKRGSNPFFVNNYMINRSIISGEFDMDQFKKNLAIFNEINLK
jgi:peptidoglycan/xylan/chitin deacetylase (PgdA/CDA1 family)